MKFSIGVDSELPPDISKLKIMLVSTDHKPEDQVTFLNVEVSEDITYMLGCILLKVVEVAAEHAKENTPKWNEAVFQ